MKILVIVNDYPTKDDVGAMFVHTRCKHYKEKGIDVKVVSGLATENYNKDQIEVYTQESYSKYLQDYGFDVLVSHAPIGSFDLPFIEKYEKNFKKIVLTFHGHEALYKSKVYSKPYQYMKVDVLRTLKYNYYDKLKLKRLKCFCKQYETKLNFVFVSNWMYEEFVKWVNYDPKLLGKARIIYNCIGKQFESKVYDSKTKKKYDFISIRSNFDGSKYCVDIIKELAEKHPQYQFLLIGKGKYFDYYDKPNNLTVEYTLLNHDEVIEKCNTAACALMLTRTDAQGVMACELATYGMPMIASDIRVMKEVFADFDNVLLVPNDAAKIQLKECYDKLKNYALKDKKCNYFEENTSGKEIRFFQELVNE